MTRKSTAPFQLRISLEEITPPIWRRVLVSPDMTLDQLHRIIQLLFSWYDYHLYEFTFKDRRFQVPDPESEAEDSTRIKLRDLRFKPGDSMVYTYDFGDNWSHQVEIEPFTGSNEVDLLPWLIDGERRGPPEDIGGPHRYMELLDALEQPPDNLDDDTRDLVDWVGRRYDPNDFGVDQLRHTLILVSAWDSL